MQYLKIHIDIKVNKYKVTNWLSPEERTNSVLQSSFFTNLFQIMCCIKVKVTFYRKFHVME